MIKIKQKWQLWLILDRKFSNFHGTTLDKIRSLLKRNSSIVQARTPRAYTAHTIERTKMKLGRNQLLNFWIWTVHRVRSSFEQNSSIHNHDEQELYLRRATPDPFFRASRGSPGIFASATGHIPFTYPTGSRLFFPGTSSTDSWNATLENSGGKFLLCRYAPPIFNFNSSYRYRLRASSCHSIDARFFFLTLIDPSKSKG